MASRTTSTVKVIQRMMEIGAITGQEGGYLLAAHRLFKGVENRLGLVLEYKGTDQPCTSEDLTALEPLEGQWVPPRQPDEGLPDLLKRTMAGVREVYLRFIGARPPD